LNLQNSICENIMSTSKHLLPAIDNATLDESGSPIPHTSNINKRECKHEDNASQISPRKRHNSTDEPQTSHHSSITQFYSSPSISPADLTHNFRPHADDPPNPLTITTSSLLSYPHQITNTCSPQKLQKSQSSFDIEYQRQQVVLRLWTWVAMLESYCKDLGIFNAEQERTLKEMEKLVEEYGGYVTS
jgi:hypothetical protein